MRKMLQMVLFRCSALGIAAVGLLVNGCSTPQKSNQTQATPATAATTPSGAQLWALNCGHCHNIRSPSSYSDAQWDVVMLHMRIRANLTAREHKELLDFLKSAHCAWRWSWLFSPYTWVFMARAIQPAD